MISFVQIFIKGFQSAITTFITDYIDTKIKELETDLLADKATLNLHTRDTRESDNIFRDLVIEIEHSHKKHSDSSFQKALRRASNTMDSKRASNSSKRKQTSASPEEIPAPYPPHYKYVAPTATYSFGSNYSYDSTPAQTTTSNYSYASTPAPNSRHNNYQQSRQQHNYNNYQPPNTNASRASHNYSHYRNEPPKDKHPFGTQVRNLNFK